MWNCPWPRRLHHYSLKSITPKTFCDRMDFGIFHHATHLWSPTLAFEGRLRLQPQTRLQPSLPWLCRKSWLPSQWSCQYDPPRFGLISLWASVSMSSFLSSHIERRLNTFYDISMTLKMSPSLTPVALENQMSCGDGWMQIGPATLILAAHTPATSSWWTADLSLWTSSFPSSSLCLLPKPNSFLQSNLNKLPFIFGRPSRILATNKKPPLKSIKTILHV